MPEPCLSVRPRALPRKLQIRQAALLTFCDPVPLECARLKHLSSGEWQKLLTWLDTSGLALYLFDRVIELQLCHWLPSSVFARLEQNLLDNTARTVGMIAESASIQQDFQRAHLSYAILKGLSLWPSSVPKPELRSQLDLDFLVADTCAAEARRILERRGYRLYAVSGRSWEFKLNEKPGITLRDLYKATPSHSVELHIEASAPGGSSPLERAEMRDLCGCSMPVLSPVDLLLGQGLHAFKHICSEFSRTSHLLEFRRHVLARRDDYVFWNKLQATADGNARASVGLGVATLLISKIIGDFAPKALTDWTVRRLPRSAELWVETYGHRSVLGSFPGTKLYLLLQAELEAAGVPAKRSLRQALLPSRLPAPVIRPFPNELLSVRLARYRMQFGIIILRLRFHIVEGIRYQWEARRWRRFLKLAAR